MASGERPRDGRVVAGRRRRDRRRARRWRRGRCVFAKLSNCVCFQLKMRRFSVIWSVIPCSFSWRYTTQTSPRRIPDRYRQLSFVSAPAGVGRSRRAGEHTLVPQAYENPEHPSYWACGRRTVVFGTGLAA